MFILILSSVQPRSFTFRLWVKRSIDYKIGDSSRLMGEVPEFFCPLFRPYHCLTRHKVPEYDVTTIHARIIIQNFLCCLFFQKPFSPTSLRSTLSATAQRQASVAICASAGGKRRDSLSSSAGASSVRRLIEVVRTTPSNMGPVYSRRLLCRNYVTLCLGHGAAAAALVPFLALQVSYFRFWAKWLKCFSFTMPFVYKKMFFLSST